METENNPVKYDKIGVKMIMPKFHKGLIKFSHTPITARVYKTTITQKIVFK